MTREQFVKYLDEEIINLENKVEFASTLEILKKTRKFYRDIFEV